MKKLDQREEYMKEFLRFDLTDPHNYHLTINDGRIHSGTGSKAYY